MTVIRKKGSMITASGDGQNITRNSSFFKRINDQPQDTVPSEVPDMSPMELTPKTPLSIQEDLPTSTQTTCETPVRAPRTPCTPSAPTTPVLDTPISPSVSQTPKFSPKETVLKDTKNALPLRRSKRQIKPPVKLNW